MKCHRRENKVMLRYLITLVACIAGLSNLEILFGQSQSQSTTEPPGAVAKAQTQTETVRQSDFGKCLVPGKFILPAKDGWWNWGMAPIYDDSGRLHIFNSSIPFKGKKGMGYWQSKSIINHYAGDSVEGPFELVETTFQSDQRTYHNPQISRVGKSTFWSF